MNGTLETSLDFRDRLAGEDLRDLCPDAQLVLDVGAGEGWFAKQARQVWPNAAIVSFEPAQRHNLTLQKMDDRHSVVRTAVGDRAGVATLNLTHGAQSNSLLGFLPDGPLAKVHAEVGHEQVPIVTLDSLTLGKVDLLKMDVQGAELQVLEGAKELLKRDRPVIYTEVSFQTLYLDHPLLADVDTFLAELGYKRLYLYESPMPDLWGDAIYVPEESGIEPTGVSSPIRLNIGAGDTVLDGFTPIDRKFGTEAYPLNYADGSVEEIRCVHMLEHLSFGEAREALKEWHRVLKPGGRLRISVPDVDKVLAKKDDHWRFYLMGGQTDGNDFHKSAYDRESLTVLLKSRGFHGIREWTSPNTDLAAADFSLNLEGFKGDVNDIENPETVKIRAILGCPRIGWNDSWQSVIDALKPFGVPIETHQGCFWAQNLHKGLERAVRDGIDWIITLDYDSMILPMHVSRLLEIMGTHPEIDACAALQMRRGSETALFSNGGLEQGVISNQPIKVNTAHFGLTVIRVECLKDIPKPWLIDRPDKDGCYNGDHVDADIHFWHQWRDAGKSLYIAPDVRIGHLELLVSEYDDDLQPRHYHIGQWWTNHAKVGHCMRAKQEI